ncbi:MAG: lipopolysaccharide heptosyltransferase II [Candidatus Omnitrophica bacterium]|nr:lipopolysaccharide heptosyltransferase II [Candidatus Omnitrophota bacterium]
MMRKRLDRILLSRTDRLGDVVLSTPVIRRLRELYPDSYIAMMVRPENRGVIGNNPHLDEIIVYDKYGFDKSFLATLRFAMRLRKKNFDAAIALHPTNRAHLIFFLAGIPERIGYDRNLAFLLTKKIPHRKQKGEKHEAELNLDLMREAGFDVTGADRHPYIITSDNDKRLVDSMWQDRKLSQKVIALHVGASCPSKRWPVERFALLADRLYKDTGSDIVLVGGDETASFSARVCSQMQTPAVDMTGMLIIGELAEFLSRCRLFISNDSGPVHVSVAVGTPVVAIFGRKDPGLAPLRWGPLGAKDQVLHRDVGCDICHAHNCRKDFACLKAITVEDAYEAAMRILAP